MIEPPDDLSKDERAIWARVSETKKITRGRYEAARLLVRILSDELSYRKSMDESIRAGDVNAGKMYAGMLQSARKQAADMLDDLPPRPLESSI